MKIKFYFNYLQIKNQIPKSAKLQINQFNEQ